MTAFVLVPGAGGAAAYWHRVVPLLEAAGHEAIAVELPAADPRAGLKTYAGRVVDAIARRRDVVLVAQSLGGFVAPIVCERVPVLALALVNAMIPRPGETPGEWGEATGSSAARTDEARRRGYSTEFDIDTYFLHDVAPEHLFGEEPEQSETIFGDACAFASWPRVPIRVIVARHDRLFPADFQRRVARERIPTAEIVELDGGHLVALSNPEALVELLTPLAPPSARR
jgi:pimeloyl-ACP methyl ester carboxylesterase